MSKPKSQDPQDELRDLFAEQRQPRTPRRRLLSAARQLYNWQINMAREHHRSQPAPDIKPLTEEEVKAAIRKLRRKFRGEETDER